MSQINVDKLGTTDGSYTVNVKDIAASNSITPEHFGAIGDGTTDDTEAITSAIKQSVKTGIPVTLGPKTYGVSSIVIPDKLVLLGCGMSTVLKKLGTSTSPVLVSKNSPTIAGVSSNTNPESINFVLKDFQVDGSWKDGGLNIEAGVLLGMSASTISNLFITNVYGVALATSGGNREPLYGMESTIEHIRIELCGKDGWDAAGPHDSTVSNVIIIDSGQLKNNTYYGIHSYPTMNMRGIALHVWHRSNSLRNKYAFFAESNGDDISNSHFEGAEESQLVIAGQNCNYSNCKAYANWSTNNFDFSNVTIRGPNNRYDGWCGGSGEGKGSCFGVALGDGTDGEYPANCYINITCNNTKLGGVNFTHEAGHNTVFISGFTGGQNAFWGNLDRLRTTYLLCTVPEYNLMYWPGDKKP